MFFLERLATDVKRLINRASHSLTQFSLRHSKSKEQLVVGSEYVIIYIFAQHYVEKTILISSRDVEVLCHDTRRQSTCEAATLK